MNFEPQKFFIGLIDFFSILLPGALSTYLLLTALPGEQLGPLSACPSTTSQAIAFFFASYLFGHLIFLIGSLLLDKWVYDPIEAAFFSKDDSLGKLAEKIRDHYLKPVGVSGGVSSEVNAFQWSKIRLAIDSPQSLSVVQRFEADSKFFRSFVVVLIGILVAIGIGSGNPREGITLVLLLFALWRYVEQRRKSTRQAFSSIIVIESIRAGGYRAPAP